jgi:polysaccharide deacetylase 2 family uncharacterized protein YibQ
MHKGVKAEQEGYGLMRGSIEGGLWALVLSGAGLSIASLVAEPPVGAVAPLAPQLTAPAVAEATVIEDAPTAISSQETEPLQQTPPSALEEPDVDAPVVQEASSVPPVVIAQVPPPLTSPQVSAPPSLPSVTTPPVIFGVADGLSVPAASQLPQIDTTPAIPPAPAVQEPIAVEETPVPAEPLPEIATPEQMVVVEPQQTDTLPEVDASDPPAVVTLPAPVIVVPDAEAVAPAQADAEPAQTGPVRINRPTTETSETAGQDAVLVTPDEVSEDQPALARYAALFENPDELPVIAIVLVDDGEMENAAQALSGLAFAPTVVIDALDSDATARMVAYRAAGAEVAMQIRLPDGAQPTDVEVAFAAAFGIMPEAAMLFSDGTGVLQSSRSVMGQVMEVLAADGQGFVTVQRGLGNAVRSAEQAGISAATVLRDLDGKGESSGAIVRTLDQAAFRARQSGGVVLMGRLRPETLAALQDWAQEATREGVAPAPASAILLDQAE